jgi:hypothetical protein
VTAVFETCLTEPQSVVLPLHYSHHISGKQRTRPPNPYKGLPHFQDVSPLHCSCFTFLFVTAAGLEPTLTESKSVMLTITSYGSFERVFRIELKYPTWKEGIINHYTIPAFEPETGIEPATLTLQMRCSTY